jgi:HEAT repeat protein
MKYRSLSIVLAIAVPAWQVQAEPLPVSTGTPSAERPAAGLKALKNAARKDPASIAVDLTSPEPRDRGQAAQALGRLGAPALPTVPALLEALTDYATYHDDAGEHVVSVEAAQAVRLIDPKSAAPAKTLTRLVRAAGAPAEHQLVKGGWVSRCGPQAAALATLSALGPIAQTMVPDVARLNRMSCTEGRALETALAIGPSAPEQLPRFAVMLNDSDPRARRSVAEYLGEARVTGAAAALGRALNDTSSSVRLAALEALEKLHPEGEGRVPLVKPFLQDDSPEIRRQSLRLLLQLAPDAPITMDLLKERLKDPDSSLVLESAEVIARVQPRSPMLLQALIPLAKGSDVNVGLQAAELLKASGSRDPLVAEALEPYREREREELMEKALSTSTLEERAKNARTLRVNAIRISKGIQDEQPDHGGRVFESGVKRLYCWTAVSLGAAPAALRHVWFFDGTPLYDVTLVATDPSSRVWSSRRIKPGRWRIDVMAPGSNEPLASASFTVLKS